MRVAFVTEGFIRPHDNGSHVACWAIAEYLLRQGHEVVSCPFIDENTATNSTYDLEQAAEIGLRTHPVVYPPQLLKNGTGFAGVAGKLKYILGMASPETYIWQLAIAQKVEEGLEEVAPDVVIMYGFGAVAAASAFKRAPKLAIVVDLLHLAILLRWQVNDKNGPLLRKIAESFRVHKLADFYRGAMIELLKDCQGQVEFAAHHAQWLREHGVTTVEYLPTPIVDPLATDETLSSRTRPHHKNRKPKILMVGDLSGVATRLGMEIFVNEILPRLEERFGADGFEVRVVGGGELPHHIAKKLDRPAVKMVGRVAPPDPEFLSCDVILVPTPVDIGMRVRIAVAFAYGCCVVTHSANAMGIPEMIHGTNALVGSTGAALADLVELAIRDSELRQRLSEQARETFQSYFSSTIAAGRVEKKLHALVQSDTMSFSQTVNYSLTLRTNR